MEWSASAQLIHILHLDLMMSPTVAACLVFTVLLVNAQHAMVITTVREAMFVWLVLITVSRLLEPRQHHSVIVTEGIMESITLHVSSAQRIRGAGRVCKPAVLKTHGLLRSLATKPTAYAMQDTLDLMEDPALHAPRVASKQYAAHPNALFALQAPALL